MSNRLINMGVHNLKLQTVGYEPKESNKNQWTKTTNCRYSEMFMLINEKNIYGQIISIKYFFLLTFFRLSLYHIYDSEEQAFHKS